MGEAISAYEILCLPIRIEAFFWFMCNMGVHNDTIGCAFSPSPVALGRGMRESGGARYRLTTDGDLCTPRKHVGFGCDSFSPPALPAKRLVRKLLMIEGFFFLNSFSLRVYALPPSLIHKHKTICFAIAWDFCAPPPKVQPSV